MVFRRRRPPIAPAGKASTTERCPSPERQPTVLHITQPGSEGVGNYVAALSQAVATMGFRVVVVGPWGSPMHERLINGHIELVDWRSSRHPTRGLRSDVSHLRRLIGAVGPDVVHLHSSKAGAAGRLAVQGRLPTVFQPHAWSYEAVDGPMVSVVAAWERFAAHWTDVLVTVSERERRNGLLRGITAPTVEVVPNPVDSNLFRPAETTRSADTTLATTAGPVALCVGRLCHQKGQDVLLAAWPRVRAAIPRAKLVLVGNGPMLAKLAASIDDSVVMLGNRDDTADLYRQADLAVMPSRWEGMSLAMLEAMASGLPVVATDVGGVTETVGHGAGAVVPVGDHRQMAEAIVVRLLDHDLREREGREARRIILADHRLEHTAAALSRIYRSVMEASDDNTSTSRAISA